MMLGEVHIMRLTYEKFEQILHQWGDYINIMFHAGTSGWYSNCPSEFASAIWESLKSESPDISEIFDKAISDIQIRDFKKAYSSPEQLLDDFNFTHNQLHSMGPHEAVTKLGKYARQVVLKEGYLEQAVLAYNQALELRRQRKQQEKKRKIGKSGKPITVEQSIGRGTRRRVYKCDNYECVYCGVKVIPDYEFSDLEAIDQPNAASIDHLIPGKYDFDNLVTACRSCNSTKSNRTPKEVGMILKFGRFLLSK